MSEEMTNQPVDPINSTPGVANDPPVDDTENQQDPSDIADPNNPPEDSAEPVEELEEVEFEGKKHKIPASLKSAIMMHADYTRKTQEVAEQRKAVETERQAIIDQAKAQQEYIQDIAKVVAMDDQIKAYEQVNWQQLTAQDPTQAQALFIQFQQLKDARNAAAGQLQIKEQQRLQQSQQAALEEQQKNAKRFEECMSVVARDIKGWGPELIKQLDKTANELGFTNDELRQVSDPRFIKLLHEANIGRQLIKKQSAPPPKPQAKPVPQVSAGGSTAKPDMATLAKTDPKKWMELREKEVRSQKRR